MYFRQRRFYQRVDVGRDHSISFRFGEFLFENVPIANLSAGGCLALLPAEDAAGIRYGAILLDFSLEHPDLPGTRISAQVVRQAEDAQVASGSEVGLGISFLSNSPQFTERVDAYVAARIRSLRTPGDAALPAANTKLTPTAGAGARS